MDISAINSSFNIPQFSLSEDKVFEANKNSFSYAYQQAIDMVSETNKLQNDAEKEEINFALGYSSSTHDLQIAQEKANIALQYTVAVRDRFLEAYKEIMNMQM